MSDTEKPKSKNGGARKGAGRPKGAISSVSMKAKAAAAESGMLPHEWLLMVSRGEPIEHHRLVVEKDGDGKEIHREYVKEMAYPDMDVRIDAAKAAAPFYAPKLAAQVVKVGGETDDLASVFANLAAQLPV